MSSALNTQVGGDHYKNSRIQHVEFVFANSIPYIEACAIKYVTRHRKKNKRQDLEKAIHYLQILITLEYGPGNDGLRTVGPATLQISLYDYFVANGITDDREKEAISHVVTHNWWDRKGEANLLAAIGLLKALADELYPQEPAVTSAPAAGA